MDRLGLHRRRSKGPGRRGRGKGPGGGLCGRGGLGRRGVHHRLGGGRLGRVGQGQQGQFQLDPLVAAPGHVFQSAAQGPDGPDGLLPGQGGGFFKVTGFFLGGDARQETLAPGQGGQHQAAVVGDQLLGETLDVHRLLTQGGQLGQGLAPLPRCQGVRDSEEVAPVGDPRHSADEVGVNLGADAGAGVQNREGVPQSAVGQPGDEGRPVVGEFQPLLPGDVAHPPGDVLRLDPGEVVPLAAGEDGGGHLLDLGGGQNKDHMGGGLFQGLEQRIEGRCGQHVHLVDDVYLIVAGAGGVGRLVPQIADIVHAVVGGGVHLHHVQDAAVVDAPAGLALAAGVAPHGVQAVDRLGENLGAGGLAGAPDAGEQIGMAHPPGGHLVFQRRHDGPLAHHVLEPLGPPFAIERTVHPPASSPGKMTENKKSGSAAGLTPALRNSAYGCRLTETHRAHHLRLLGSPPDLVRRGPVVQDPHPYAEPRSKALSDRKHKSVALCAFSIVPYSGGKCKGIYTPALPPI